jgi:hypothetical protein
VDTYISGHHHAYYAGRRGTLELLHTGALGEGPRPLLGTVLPSPRTVTILDLDAASSLGTNIYQIASDSDGNIFSAAFSGEVLRIAPNGDRRALETGFGAGRLVTVATTPDGDVIAAERGGQGRILQLRADGARDVVYRPVQVPPGLPALRLEPLRTRRRPAVAPIRAMPVATSRRLAGSGITVPWSNSLTSATARPSAGGVSSHRGDGLAGTSTAGGMTGKAGVPTRSGGPKGVSAAVTRCGTPNFATIGSCWNGQPSAATGTVGWGGRVSTTNAAGTPPGSGPVRAAVGSTA